VVNNVETLARVAMLASGIDDDGRQLITISTPSGQTVIEAAPHDRLAALIASTGASDVGTSAVLLGGYGGTWHRWNDVASVPFMGLKSIVNAGIVMTLPHTMCGLATTARIFRYMASSSARQCGPCVFGLGELADVMDRVAAGKARRSDLTRLEQLTETVRGRGACHHPDGAVGMLTSAISVFGREFGAHRRSQRCARSHDLVVPGLRAA
jgi:NADH:ubiquinone oxidoreductase subunit F (NADH-binding)